MQAAASKIRFRIGVDPGMHTGVAVYDMQAEQFTRLVELDFWRAFEYLVTFPPAETELHIEDPSKISTIYARNQREAGAARDMMAQRVGGNKREATLLVEGLERKGYRVERVAPRRRSKWSDADFRAITQHDARTNEHVRDAARLVWERRLVQSALNFAPPVPAEPNADETPPIPAGLPPTCGV